ncbi:MAG: hypothetical protein H0W36_07090 [Gemmatimonadetes bacterium]|nr:hypothetical protein [Gemmatimonadota bacterium]
MKFTESIFLNDAIDIDDNEFTSCTFDSCTLAYSGGEFGKITDCSFNACRWEFSGAASRTVAFMKAMYQGMGDGGRQIVEDLFEKIRIT